MKTGIELIEAERKRQIEVEGFTPEHDKQYKEKELAFAAICYWTPPQFRTLEPPENWPFEKSRWKPSPDNRIKELVKAGALFLAQGELEGSHEHYPEIRLIADKIDHLIKNGEGGFFL